MGRNMRPQMLARRPDPDGDQAPADLRRLALGNAGPREKVVDRLRSKALLAADRRTRRVAGGGYGGRRGVPSRDPDPWLRAPVRHLQTPHPATARPGTAVADSLQPRAPGATGNCGQSPSQRWRGAGPDPSMDEFHPRPGLEFAGSLSGRLRHADDRATGGRRRSLGQHPAQAVGSQRHQRHEGTGKRRPERFGAGRLVGGSLHSGRGAGPLATGASMATIRRGTPPRPMRFTTCWSARLSRNFISATRPGFPGSGWRACARA